MKTIAIIAGLFLVLGAAQAQQEAQGVKDMESLVRAAVAQQQAQAQQQTAPVPPIIGGDEDEHGCKPFEESRDASAENDDAELKSLLVHSDVVVGRVVAIEVDPSDKEEHSRLRGRIATIRVKKTLKGKPVKDILAWFSASYDGAWFDSPKLIVGQKSIFIFPIGIAGPVYRLSDSHQVQPLSNAKKIKQLLANR